MKHGQSEEHLACLLNRINSGELTTILGASHTRSILPYRPFASLRVPPSRNGVQQKRKMVSQALAHAGDDEHFSKIPFDSDCFSRQLSVSRAVGHQ